MNDLDIFLVSIISYMSGIFTGLVFCFKYSDKLVRRTLSNENLSNMNPNQINYNPPAQVIASAPSLREIKITTTE